MTPSPTVPPARRSFIQDELTASAETKKKTYDACGEEISAAVDLIIAGLRNGKKLLFCGNGGSAADSQHLAAEFVIRMNPAIKRPGLPAIALTTDSSMITAGANDFGYENVFARAVEALGNPGDILIGISTSGKSQSVNNATKGLVNLAIIIPSSDTQRIQEGHITVGHIICALVEREMFG